jgi:hypothetical protein
MTFRDADDFRTIYVNWVQIAAGPIDLSIILSEAHPSGPTGFEVENKTRVMITPLQSKILLAILANTLQGYEAQFGEIKIPSELATQLASQRKKQGV